MYLANCASYELAIYTYEEWFNHGCIVAISSDQISGITSSPNIRGQVTLSGTVYALNTLSYSVCVADQHTGTTYNHNGNEAGFHGARYERFQCAVVGIYSNRALILDSKSGILSEAVYSAQLGESLRLSNSAE